MEPSAPCCPRSGSCSILPNIRSSLSICTNLWCEDVPVYVCRRNSLLKHQQKWPPGCKIAQSIPNSRLQRNSRILFVWSYCALTGRVPFWGQTEPPEMPGVQKRCVGPGRRGRENPGKKSVPLTQRLSSTNVLLCSHQLGTNKDVWEENRSRRSRCEGKTHAGVWRSMSGTRSLSEMINDAVLFKKICLIWSLMQFI